MERSARRVSARPVTIRRVLIRAQNGRGGVDRSWWSLGPSPTLSSWRAVQRRGPRNGCGGWHGLHLRFAHDDLRHFLVFSHEGNHSPHSLDTHLLCYHGREQSKNDDYCQQRAEACSNARRMRSIVAHCAYETNGGISPIRILTVTVETRRPGARRNQPGCARRPGRRQRGLSRDSWCR